MELWVHWPRLSITLEETASSVEPVVWSATWLKNLALLSSCTVKRLQMPLFHCWYLVLVIQEPHSRWQLEHSGWYANNSVYLYFTMLSIRLVFHCIYSSCWSSQKPCTAQNILLSGTFFLFLGVEWYPAHY